MKKRRKRSKSRDLLIIIRLFICCIAIVLFSGPMYVMRKLCASENFCAPRIERQFIAGIKGEDIPRRISELFHRRCFRRANQAKNEQKARHKKRNCTLSYRNETCSRLQPPPVKELIFTRDDVWSVKNDTSRLTQAQARVYSGDGVKRNPDGERNNRSNWVNYSPISFSREAKQSALQQKSSNAQLLKNKSVKRCNLEWLQRGKRQWLTNANMFKFRSN